MELLEWPIIKLLLHYVNIQINTCLLIVLYQISCILKQWLCLDDLQRLNHEVLTLRGEGGGVATGTLLHLKRWEAHENVNPYFITKCFVIQIVEL